jgi:hypothetical protein
VVGETLQVTPVVAVPVTVAVNWFVPPWRTVAVIGLTETVTSGTVTVAVAFLVISAALAAVMVHVAATAGAVKTPDVLMLPPPLTDQVTAVLVEPVTVAVKVLVASWFTVAVAGLMLIATGFTVTVAVPDPCGVAALLAVMVKVPAAAGAVYKPVALIVPAEQDHVTAVLVLPVMAAVNCWVAPWLRVTVAGLTTTFTGTVAVAVAFLVASALLVAVMV